MRPSPDPSRAGERVRLAVASLPPGMRDVVELGVFQDLPYAEISEIVSIPVGTVFSAHGGIRPSVLSLRLMMVFS